jgi:hypothetical protein
MPFAESDATWAKPWTQYAPALADQCTVPALHAWWQRAGEPAMPRAHALAFWWCASQGLQVCKKRPSVKKWLLACS